jgi:diguanylate cyclase (GGDEF)-like protein
MLRGTGSEGLVLTQVERVDAAAQELLEHGASCILLGLNPPEAGGFDQLDEIRAAAPHVPIVVLADSTNAELGLQALRHGAQDFLCKPLLDPIRLRTAVAYAIERKRSEVRLAHKALHDQLTGLPNRALFIDRLTVALDRSRRTRSAVAVLFLDVDGFKQVNDSLGHASGDRVLIGLANRLQGMLRPMDTVARFGGDEFTLLFEELTDEREVVRIAERVSHAAGLPLAVDNREVSVSVSIGIAMVTDPTVAPDTLIREADAAMYRAKELGPSRYELFDESTRQRAMDRLELETALRHAVEHSELRVHYQPEIALGPESEVFGFEALVRWQHPKRGLIPPSEFIPLAEETGIVLDIGAFVLEQALIQLGRWRDTNPEVTIAVNLSPRQLEDAGLLPMPDAAIRSSGADPATLCLEITESAVNGNPEAALRMLEALKTLGVTLAIDDYGTGYSSLSNLRRLPVDWLKIHESFVSELGRGSAEVPIVGAVVDLAHALGLSTIAEGVETNGQLEQLRQLGCDGAQGYLLGRPVPEEETDALLPVG